MAFVSEIFDQIRLLTNDAADSQFPFTTKRLYVNRGIARLYPRIYSVATVNITIVSGTYDYSLVAAVMDGFIISVEMSTASGGSEFERFERYDIIAGDEDLAGVFRLGVSSVTYAGYLIRVRYAKPVSLIAATTYVASQSETWSGPDRALNLPVLYAMAFLSAGKLDDRQDTLRYSTTQATNGVTDSDLMQATQMWMGQFELEMGEMERPLPISKD